MKKVLLIMLMLLLIVGSVLAISFYADVNMKGQKIYNATNVELVSPGNITGVGCITFISGGSICTG